MFVVNKILKQGYNRFSLALPDRLLVAINAMYPTQLMPISKYLAWRIARPAWSMYTY
jgi:hypothetical protein